MPPARFAHATVMVTGAQGFIGSWLAERLLAEGANVVVHRLITVSGKDVQPEIRGKGAPHAEAERGDSIASRAGVVHCGECATVRGRARIT